MIFLVPAAVRRMGAFDLFAHVTRGEIFLGGLLCLLLLILLLVVAERKARAVIHKRQTFRVRDAMTAEELAAWRARQGKVHSGEIEALKLLDEEYRKRARTRSGEWKRDHEPNTKDEETP
jgi:hypothetical protein